MPWWDAFPTAGSVVGQWLLGRKYVENWPVWVVVNMVSVGLFAYKGLWLTVVLYALFIVLSVAGWRAWRALEPPLPSHADAAFVIAMLGAESTGKTHAGRELHAALAAEGRRVAAVGEVPARVLRRAQAARRAATSRPASPHEQSARIDAAAQRARHRRRRHHRADDRRLQRHRLRRPQPVRPGAGRHHARCDLTLLTALDLPWVADGLQRDGPQVREPVDTLLRAALHALPASVTRWSAARARHAWTMPSARSHSHAMQ